MIMVKLFLALILCAYLAQIHLPLGPSIGVAGQKLPPQVPKTGRRRNAFRFRAVQRELAEMKQMFGQLIKFTRDERFGVLLTISHVVMPIILGMNFTMMLYLTSTNMIQRGETAQNEGEYNDDNVFHRQVEAPRGPSWVSFYS